MKSHTSKAIFNVIHHFECNFNNCDFHQTTFNGSLTFHYFKMKILCVSIHIQIDTQNLKINKLKWMNAKKSLSFA
jgi:hypothetical protein